MFCFLKLLSLGCQAPCVKESFSIKYIKREKMTWETNWTSELFLEAYSGQVKVKHVVFNPGKRQLYYSISIRGSLWINFADFGDSFFLINYR